MVAQSPRPVRTDCSNVALWLLFVVTIIGTDGFFLVLLHRRPNYDAVFAVAGLLARTSVFVALGILIEALIIRANDGYFTLSKLRRSSLHAYYVSVMLLCVALVVDILVYAFAGYHLSTAVRILFSDGPAGVGQVVEATGLSVRLFLLVALGVLAGLGLAIWLSKQSRRLSARFGFVIFRRQALRAQFMSVGALALVELMAVRVRNPYLWEREIHHVPFAFSVVRPKAELASFRAKVRAQAAPRELTSSISNGAGTTRPDIFFVILESLRSDVVTPDVMPKLSGFTKTAWTFEHAVTTGNVTHYSWFGLLCSQYPIYFDAIKSQPNQQGSLALARLSQAGYKIHLLATPDTQYQNLEAIVFGGRGPNRDGSLLTSLFHPKASGVAERDSAVIQELGARLSSSAVGGNVYILALDSTHYEYAWGKDFAPPFLPYAKTVPITHDYAHDAAARRMVSNRYKNSAAWVDHLLGRFFGALGATSRLDKSIVVVTGDHGEAFWEQGVGTHGSSLSREQLEVGLAIRLPNRTPKHHETVFSLLDVMPSILKELGLDTSGLDGAPFAVPVKDAAALSFQGWNEQAYNFSLTLPTRRLRFELDHEEPLKARHLLLKDVTDLHDVSLVGREGSTVDDSYDDVLHNLPAVLSNMRFLEL